MARRFVRAQLVREDARRRLARDAGHHANAWCHTTAIRRNTETVELLVDDVHALFRHLRWERGKGSGGAQ